MNTLPAIVGDPIVGLSLLMKPEGARYYKHIDYCRERVVPKPNHPFGLDLPRHAFKGKCVRFVGAHATDMTVEVFVAHVRFWAGSGKALEVTRLRVISTHHNHAGKKSRHYIFFEIWVGICNVFISGETTDFSEAGREACWLLESVFAVLSMIYEIPIERVIVEKAKAPRIEDLYRREERSGS